MPNLSSESAVQVQQQQQHQQRKRAACDRCRAQKLACTYDTNSSVANVCQRCQRAGAECHHSPSLRMGRRPVRGQRRSSVSVSASISQTPTPQSCISSGNENGNGIQDGRGLGLNAESGSVLSNVASRRSQEADVNAHPGPGESPSVDYPNADGLNMTRSITNQASLFGDAGIFVGVGADANPRSCTQAQAPEAATDARKRRAGTNMDSFLWGSDGDIELLFGLDRIEVENQDHSWENLDMDIHLRSAANTEVAFGGPFAEHGPAHTRSRSCNPSSSSNPTPTPISDSSLFTAGIDFHDMLEWDTDPVDTAFFSSPDKRSDVQLVPTDVVDREINPVQKLAELNPELQKLVLMSEDGNGWTVRDCNFSPSLEGKTGSGEFKATKSKLLNDFLKAKQTLLDILHVFQPAPSKRCSACKRGHMAPSDRGRNPDAPWPNTQTLLSMISCYVQLLRLCSNFFCHVSDTIAAHSGGDCIGLDHLSLLADQQISSLGGTVRLTIDLQVSILIQIIVHLLDSIERALGCNSTASLDSWSPVDIDSSKEKGSLQQHKCSTCCSHTTGPQKSIRKGCQDDAGLLGRCRSQELLEMVIKHEDMESQADGRRSIRLLRKEISRVKEML
ncbi:uncharacterized protein PAC_08249 [Phialocephala subalpina]|uniref:Zn(2)-C6 fungal-type domain-containing protein n=1 Tax=Phialocephala subalpina TaxID=576137 RepID=A0A1L7X025_9HELO|nr:uncharacterized protein PAC_08249 [Phialocephala subalpina]